MEMSKKKINFGKLTVGELFYIEKSDKDKLIECEKLTNNLSEDNEGNTFFLVSSDVVIIEPVNS